VKAVKVSLDPARKVMPYSENLSLSLQAKVEFEGHPAIVDSEKPLDLGGKATAKVTKVEWQAITDPSGGITLKIEKNQLTPKLEFTQACAVTALATVTVVVSKTLNAKTIEEHYVLPSVRADLWALSPPLLTAVDGHLPGNGIVGAGRTFEVATCSFKIGSLDCNWSSKTGFSPGVSFQPAQPGIASVSAAGLAFSWKGPNKPITKDPIFVPVFQTPGLIAVDLSIDLEFFQDGKFPLGKKPFIVDVRPIDDWLAKKIVPASFSLVLGQKEKFEFTYSLKPPIDNEFQISPPSIIWLQEGQVIGQTNPFEYIAKGSGTVTLEAKADFSFVEKDFDPPAQSGNDLASSTVQGQIIVPSAKITSIEFISDHNVLRKNPTSGSLWGDSDIPFEVPEWVPGSYSNPITQTKNSKIIAIMKIQVVPAKIKFDLIGDCEDDFLDFLTPGQISTGEDQDITVIANAPLPDQVCVLEKSINWKVNVGSSVRMASSRSSHRIYVTYGYPEGSDPTDTRLSWSCNACKGQTEPDDIVSAANDYINTNRPPIFIGGTLEWPPGTPPIWMLLDENFLGGACIAFSNLLKHTSNILGISEGSLTWVFASKDDDFDHKDIQVIDGTTCTVVVFKPKSETEGESNFFEGCFEFNGKYYPGAWFVPPFLSKKELHARYAAWPNRLIWRTKPPDDPDDPGEPVRFFDKNFVEHEFPTTISQENCIPIP
jgi:hypothetical protein